MIRQVVKDCFTVANGQDYDLGRLLWAAVIMVFICLAILHWRAFDPQSYGIGAGGLLAGGGGALGFKARSEPQ